MKLTTSYPINTFTELRLTFAALFQGKIRGRADDIVRNCRLHSQVGDFNISRGTYPYNASRGRQRRGVSVVDHRPGHDGALPLHHGGNGNLPRGPLQEVRPVRRRGQILLRTTLI